MIDGEDVRRSYSICADATTSVLRVGIKQLPGGAFSTWAITELRVGDELEVMPPVGEFTIDPDPAGPAIGAIAAGSGITPVLSLVATTLAVEPESRHGRFSTGTGRPARSCSSTSWRAEEPPSRPAPPGPRPQPGGSDLPLLSGRIDAAKSDAPRPPARRARRRRVVPVRPFEMVMAARRPWAISGSDEARIHDELFFAGPLDPAPCRPSRRRGGAVSLTVISTEGPSRRGCRPRLRSSTPPSGPPRAAVLLQRRDVRHLQGPDRRRRGGMAKNYALVDSELEAGFVLTCQSHPVADRVVVRYDHR